MITKNLFFVTMGVEKNRSAWFYINIDSGKERKFKHCIESKANVDLKDWGEIVESGYGKSPPDYIKEKMKRLYSFN